MKHLHETFTDQEFASLSKAKDDTKLSWRKFLLSHSFGHGKVYCPNCGMPYSDSEAQMVRVNCTYQATCDFCGWIAEIAMEEVKTL